MITQAEAVEVNATVSNDFVSLNELKHLCESRPTAYLIEGLLPAHDVHVAVGDSGLGKTPWAYQLGLCVSTGEPFLGYVTNQGRVLYLDLENGPEAVFDVADALCDYLGIHRYPEQFLVRRDETIPDLARAVARYAPSLTIIDTMRPFAPEAEKDNTEMGRFLNEARSIARASHCTILLLHHIRKPGENGTPPLEETPALEWLNTAAGARALINQTNTRIAFDSRRQHPETALVMKYHVKMRGESGPIYVERVCDSNGEPSGYRRMTGVKLLGNAEQEAAYNSLPETFAFGEAMDAYKKSDDPTRKWLIKCMDVGILEQPRRRGAYRKLNPVEKVETVEQSKADNHAPLATSISMSSASLSTVEV